MVEFEKDFVMRQVKDIAKGLRGFLTEDSIDEILQVDQEDAQENKANKFKERNLNNCKRENVGKRRIATY